LVLALGLFIGYGIGRNSGAPTPASATATAPQAAQAPAPQPAAAPPAQAPPAPTVAVAAAPAPTAAAPTVAVAAPDPPAALDPEPVREDPPPTVEELPPEVQAKLPNTAFSLQGAPLKGDITKARVTIIVFADFQCPFCSKSRATLDQIMKHYGESVVVAFRHLPLDFHPDAVPAAKAAIAAGNQNKFWEFHDKIFDNQENLTAPQLERYASELELDMARFKTDMASTDTAATLEVDKILASSSEITGTPAFLINGTKMLGALPFDTFKDTIDSNLSRVQAKMDAGKSLAQARGEVNELNIFRNPRKDGGNGDPRALRKVDISTAPGKGAADPLVAIAVFSDFQCPHCSKLPPVLDRIMSELPDEVRIVFRHNPLQIHADAPLAAQASLEAHRQGKFWEFHDRLFANQADLSRAALEGHASALGLKMDEFKEALDKGTHKDAVAADMTTARTAGADGTPTMFINGRILTGALPYEDVRKVVDAAREQSDIFISKGAATRGGYYKQLMNMIPQE